MSNSNNRLRILFVPAGNIAAVNKLGPEDTLIRCLMALRQWEMGQYDYLVVTGGCFLPPAVQTKPAGQLMATWFEQQGVEHERIVIEYKSLDTFDSIHEGVSAMRTYGLGEPKQWAITVVTQWQHSWCYWLSFWAMYKLKIKRRGLVYPISWPTWLREFALIAYHFYDPCGTGWVARRNREQRRRAAAGE